MPKEKPVVASFTIDRPLLKKATDRARKRYGKRGFSDYIKSAIKFDFLKNKN